MSRKTLLRFGLLGFVALGPVLMPLAGFGQPTRKVKAHHQPTSIRTIRCIFNNYHEGLGEGVESAENKAAMKSALESIPPFLNDNDMLLLVNVWMYYDPPDFPTRDLLSPVFFRNKERSLGIVTRRLAHKKKYEARDKAPYLDLVELQKQLRQ